MTDLKQVKWKSIPKEIITSALWWRGDLSYKLGAHQRQIYEAYWNHIKSPKGRTFAANVSRRYGKSFVGALIAFEYAIRFPDSKVKFVCPTQSQMHTVLEEIIPILTEDCPDNLYQKRHGRFKFWNGSEIQVGGTDLGGSNRMRGTSTHLAMVDEAGFSKDLKYLLTSVLGPTCSKVNGKIIVYSTPPFAIGHYFTKLCLESKAAGRYITKNIKDDAWMDADKYAECVADCMGEDSTDFKREYLCEFVTDEDIIVVPQWNTEKMTVVPVKDQYYTFYHKYVALDIGVRDNTAAVFGYLDYRNGGTLVIEDEYTINGNKMTTEILAEAIKEREKNLWAACTAPNPRVPSDKVYKRVGDTNNLLLLQDLSVLHDLPFVPTGKNRLYQMVNRLKLLIKEDRLRVHPRCKMVIGCLENAYWDDNHRGFAHSADYSHFDHLAALIYLVLNLDDHVNPIPVNYGASRDTHIILNSDDSPRAQELKSLSNAILGRRR